MTPIIGEEFGLYYNSNFWIIIPILMTLVFMYMTCPGALSVFTEGSFAGKMKALGKGFLLGVIAISILTFFAAVSKTVTFQYRGFNWRILPALLPLFIQCTAEELLLRGYVPAVAERNHRWDAVCFLSGILFIFHHILNMEYYGYSTMFCLNVFLLGVLFCLLVKAEGNFWIASGIHLGWNYMQTCVLGVTASGEDMSIGMFQGTLNQANGFFQQAYGYEGSVTAAVLSVICLVDLIVYLKKKGKLQ